MYVKLRKDDSCDSTLSPMAGLDRRVPPRPGEGRPQPADQTHPQGGRAALAENHQAESLCIAFFFKGTESRDFYPCFFHDSNASGFI